MKIEYKALDYDNGKKLKDILKKRLYFSCELLKKLKYTNSIFVNGEPKFVTYIVKANDTITIDLDNYINSKNVPKFSEKFKLQDAPLDILYEDEYLLIVSKPYNMPTHPSSSNYDNTLSNIVANYLEKQNIYNIHIITRLDKDTTGICIFAKNEYIQELFVKKKNKICLTKKYIAIVDGSVETPHGIIEKNIERIENSVMLRHAINNNDIGDYAKTEYTVLKINEEKNYTILEVILHTGRTHQIRVHMIDMGHILLGDTLYADYYNIPNVDKYIKRQALHAYIAEFNHPITNRKICIKAPLYEDMKRLV